MASITVSPLVGTDDGGWYPTWNNFENIGSASRIGVYSGSLYASHAFYRFPSVTIPQGAIITNATLILRAYSSPGGGPATLRVYGNAIDNATAPTSVITAEALNLTTEYVAWSIGVGAWAASTDYSPGDLSAVIQEIISRAGWSSGNALMLLVKNVGTAQGYETPQNIEDDDPLHMPARLVIEYTHIIYSDIDHGLLKILPTNVGHIAIDGTAPQYWFQWGNNIVIEPVPDAAYSLTLSISDYPTAELTLTTEYPTSLPDEFHPCVVDFACYVLSMRLKKWGQASRFYNLYINNLKKRRKEYIDRKVERRSGHIIAEKAA
ncbi:MAG: hypothetical protein V1736_09740 [Pseudomonadota bacterium]